jgi:putative peptide zinc metalloprotease protein
VDRISLPPLREELSLHPGPTLGTGEPSHTLEDPVRNQFFRIDWMTFEILKRWSLGNPDDILLSIEAGTPLNIGVEDIAAVLKFLHDNQLLQPDPLGSVKAMAARHKAAAGTWYTQLLHHYLFFRIPLVKPDRWLTRIAPAFGWIFSVTFARLTVLALVFGGVQIYREWDQFRTTLMDTFTPGGLFTYGLALIGVKCAHELGHALTAKRHGCRVPTMGVAFLVMWPVPYTDTNDVWRLANKRHRQQVAAAGVATELLIAVWSTLAWAVLPDGMLRSIAFPLATTTWLATLAINASPFMRFDGYFLLSDWLDMPNLHARAFALARWDLRERLFALGEPPPEYVSRRRQWGLILFAWGVWLYRLTLFIGIAVLVYHFFIKLVGIFLFCIEMSWFILRPIANEIAAWRTLWPTLKSSRRARRSALLLLSALLVFVVPWPTRIQASGMLRPANVFPIHAPAHAQLASLPFREGDRVNAGQMMMQFAAAENDSRRQALEAQIEQLRWQSQAAGFDAEQRARSGVLREQLATAEAELASLMEDASHYRPVAPFAGTLRDIDPELAPGTWVGRNERLAVLVSDKDEEVSTYLDEDTVRRVAVGDSARFYPDGLEGPFVRLTVTGIDQDASHTLPNGMWTTQHGGSVPAREKQGAWFPDHAVYRVSFSVSDKAGPLAGRAWRGKVVIAGAWEAPGMRFMRSAAALLWREAGF